MQTLAVKYDLCEEYNKKSLKIYENWKEEKTCV